MSGSVAEQSPPGMLELLVMGGTRFAGRAIVERALREGHAVTVVHRGNFPSAFSAPVRELRGDRSAPETLYALAAREFDAVIDLSGYKEAQVRLLAGALPEVPLWINISTAAVYEPQPTFPWGEETPLGPSKLWGDYAREKLAAEQALQETRAPRTATVSLRLPYVLGPCNYAPREEFVFNRLLDGEQILLPGGGAALIQFIHVEQLAATVVAIAERGSDSGFVPVNVGTREYASLEGFVKLSAQLCESAPRLRAVDGGATGTGELAFNASDCVFCFPNDPYVLDTTRLESLGLQIPQMSLAEMLEGALRALLADPSRRQWQRTSAERRLL